MSRAILLFQKLIVSISAVLWLNYKNEAIKLLQNIDLTEKVEHYEYPDQFEAINLLEILF